MVDDQELFWSEGNFSENSIRRKVEKSLQCLMLVMPVVP